MTRRFRPITIDGVSHMIDDPNGDWVRWCDCRDVERELARLRDWMPEAFRIDSFCNLVDLLIHDNHYHNDHPCVLDWLRSIAKESGACGR